MDNTNFLKLLEYSEGLIRQKEWAEVFDVPASTVSAWKRGKRSPNDQQQRVIALIVSLPEVDRINAIKEIKSFKSLKPFYDVADTLLKLENDPSFERIFSKVYSVKAS